MRNVEAGVTINQLPRPSLAQACFHIAINFPALPSVRKKKQPAGAEFQVFPRSGLPAVGATNNYLDPNVNSITIEKPCLGNENTERLTWKEKRHITL